MKTRRNLAVIVASGLGLRMESDMPKQFMEILGKPILAWTIAPFERCRLIDEIILVVPEEYLAFTSQSIVDKYDYRKILKIITNILNLLRTDHIMILDIQLVMIK